MMQVIDMGNFGGCIIFPGEEQRFKTTVINNQRSKILQVFEIENEEKEPGFPDSLEILRGTAHADGYPYINLSILVEYKVSDKNGIIKFESKQPLFYKNNSFLMIVVRAWSVPDQTGYQFHAVDILEALLARAKKGRPVRSVCVKGGELS
jgi:hypothetical protein